MVRLVAQIEGIGLLGPGLDGWTGSMALLEDESRYIRQPIVIPIPDGLPPAERRRIGRMVKLALSVGLQATAKAGIAPDDLPAVFASSGGDGENCHEICQALARDERMISPTRFHNSVHNAAAGYWSIATRSRAPSNALGAFDASFAAGLLEAVTQTVVDQTRVLLVAYDTHYPPPLFQKRPIPEPFGVAFVLSPVLSQNEQCIARLTVDRSDSPPDHMSNPDLEAVRASIPAARSLPLLRQLALRRAGSVNIQYLDGHSLAVEVDPCT
jgi:hypothetical protein